MISFPFSLLATALISGTCGVYSPDGEKIAFQKVADGKSRLMVFDRVRGTSQRVEPGAGNAAHPAWHPAGDALVYTYGDETKTAWAARQDSTGYHLRIWRPGAPLSTLTTGRFRDYMPSFSADGRKIFFVSTRETPPEVMQASRSSVFAINVDGTGVTNLVRSTMNNTGMGQPVQSPDGTLIAYAKINSFYDTWQLVCARSARPARGCLVTPAGHHAYAPRWTPDGRHLVYTGFSRGDPTWCIYVLNPQTGALRRLCPGRNPDVHPSGKWILYDDGATLHERPFDPADEPCDVPTNMPQMISIEPERVFWQCQTPHYPHRQPMDNAFIFGTERTFFVRAKIKFVNAEEPRFRHYVTGSYEGAPLGFELFVDRDTPKFGVRDASGRYLGVVSNLKLKEGRTYLLTGIRTNNRLFVSVDDTHTSTLSFHGTYPLTTPLSLQLGPTLTAQNEIISAEIGTGWPNNIDRPATHEEIFGRKETLP